MLGLGLLAVFTALMLAPLAAAGLSGLPPRPIWDEIASGMALGGLAGLLLLFCLSGRFQTINRPIGIDATMRFHQVLARPLTVILLLHPFLYSLPYAPPVQWDPTNLTRLSSSSLGLLTGIGAWVLLVAVTMLGVLRPRLSLTYEEWRGTHTIGALAIAVLGAVHALEMGRYTTVPGVIGAGAGLLVLALGTLVWVHLVRPLRHLMKPYSVTAITPLTSDTWEVTVEPEGTRPALPFRAGQFVWLTFDRSPFSLREHPFSIVSAPATRPAVTFAIRAAGDFTNTIGEIPLGTRAYLDGPHGGLRVPKGRYGDAPGLCMIAGGTGIAPILSILRDLDDAGDTRPIWLFYGNHTVEDVLYRAALADIAARRNLMTILAVDTPPGNWTGERGPVDADMLGRHLSWSEAADLGFVICGPPAMIDATVKTLRDNGVTRRQISAEKFSFG